MYTNLPNLVEFIGRASEKERILASLEKRRLAVISGIGGIGKTSLAYEMARLWQKNGGRFVWMTARDDPGGDHILGHFDTFTNTLARALDRPGLDSMALKEKLDIIRECLASKSFLIVVDSLESVDSDFDAIFEFAVTIPEPSAFLVTTRELPTSNSIQKIVPALIRLGDMTFDETKLLMMSLVKNTGVTLVSVSDQILTELYEKIGGHPLLISWVVAEIVYRGRSLHNVMKQITKGEIADKLDEMFSLAYNHLKEHSPIVLQALTVFSAPVHKEALTYVTELSRKEVDQALEELIAASLIEVDTRHVTKDRRCSVHPLVRQYAGGRLKEFFDRENTLRFRLIDWLIREAVDLVVQTPAVGYELFRCEIPNVVALSEWCIQIQNDRKLVELVDATHHLLWELGFRAEEHELCRLGYRAAIKMEEYDMAWRLAYSLGWSEYRRANYAEAKRWADEIQRLSKTGKTLWKSSSVVDDLRAHIHLNTYQSKSHSQVGGKSQSETSDLEREARQYAKRLIKRALNAFQDSGDGMNAAFAMTHLGEIELAMGNYLDAKRWFEQLLSVALRSQSMNVIAWTLGNLGDVYYELGDIQRASDYYITGLQYAERLRRDTTVAHCKKGLALVAMQNDLYNEARGFLRDALLIYEAQRHEQKVREVRSALDKLEKRAWDETKAEGLRQWNNQDTGPLSPQPMIKSHRSWALLVGVNHYEDNHINDLKVCVADVITIHHSLDKTYEAAKFLTDATTGRLPTRVNVLAELSAVAQAAEERDLFFFYFSGHGVAEAGESYLLPRDARIAALKHTGISMRSVREIMDSSAARAKVIILDACHSGASIGKSETVMTEEFIRRVFEEAEGMVVLASCKQGQKSWEWPEQGRSVFTHYLLEALTGQADFDSKGFVTVSDVNRYVSDGVRRWAAEHGVPQTPTLQSSVAGDIVLVRYA